MMRFHQRALVPLLLQNLVSNTSSFSPVAFRSQSLHASTLVAGAEGDIRKIGIFGGGVVGGGIVEILTSKADHFQQLADGTKIEISKICVRDASKPRDFTVPDNTEIVTDYDDILEDSDIDMVVEVMGGTTDAKDVIYKAISKGKDIVTANKALIAAHMGDIEKILAGKPDVEFRYEAAVCGGIPIIRSMQSDFVGDDVTMLSGIINGCTNFMLTAMDRDGKSYDDALAEASALGYAEADPTLDVGGFDARSKLKILMRLAYGIDVEEDDISCKGITGLTKIDFKYAKMLGGTIKLIGVAKTLPGNKVAAFVSPCYLTNDDTLASVAGATNAIEVESNNLQRSTYIGQGAGRFPTANSCINDIVALAKGDTVSAPFNPVNNEMTFSNDFEAMFFLRLKYRDQIGITRQCGEACEKYGVSIYSLLQTPKSGEDDAFAIITEKVKFSSVKKACAEIEGFDWCKGGVYVMPVLREDQIHGE